MNRLEYYVGLLEDSPRQVIVGLFFEGRSVDDIAGSLGVARKTVYAHRQTALVQLAEMYERIAQFYGNDRLF